MLKGDRRVCRYVRWNVYLKYNFKSETLRTPESLRSPETLRSLNKYEDTEKYVFESGFDNCRDCYFTCFHPSEQSDDRGLIFILVIFYIQDFGCDFLCSFGFFIGFIFLAENFQKRKE